MLKKHGNISRHLHLPGRGAAPEDRCRIGCRTTGAKLAANCFMSSFKSRNIYIMNWVMSNGNKWNSLRRLFTDVVFNWAFLFMPFGVCLHAFSSVTCFFLKGSSSTWFLLFFGSNDKVFFPGKKPISQSCSDFRKYGLLFTHMVPRCDGIWGYRCDAERSGGSSVTWIKLQGKFNENSWNGSFQVHVRSRWRDKPGIVLS